MESVARAGRSGRRRPVVDGFVPGLTFWNGFFLFATIVFAVGSAENFDNPALYGGMATAWVAGVYLNVLRLLGHLRALEGVLAEPHDSLEALRGVAEVLPIMGLLPFLAVDWLLR